MLRSDVSEDLSVFEPSKLGFGIAVGLQKKGTLNQRPSEMNTISAENISIKLEMSEVNEEGNTTTSSVKLVPCSK